MIEDFVLAQDAYIYRNPVVTMEYTRRIMTNVVLGWVSAASIGNIIGLRGVELCLSAIFSPLRNAG